MEMLALILNLGPTWKYPRARWLASGRTDGLPRKVSQTRTKHRRRPEQCPDHRVVSDAPCTWAGGPGWGQ